MMLISTHKNVQLVDEYSLNTVSLNFAVFAVFLFAKFCLFLQCFLPLSLELGNAIKAYPVYKYKHLLNWADRLCA